MKLKEDYKKELHSKMLDMIKDIDILCKKHDIEYYLIYGSALGAVRHKGFIPWDDDFDIGMTDDNYFKFLKVCEKELDKNKYYIQTPEKEKNYYLSFAKIRDITTTLIEKSNSDIEITYGVFIDVFPLVGVPENKLKRMLLKINRAFMLSANINVINNKFLKLIFDIILKIFGRKNILTYCTKNCFKYKCKDYNKWVSICDGDGFDINEVDSNVMGSPKYVKFEDTMLPIPNNEDEYLKKIYNDYMRIPTEEEIKKKEHTPYLVDLNLSYKDYKKNKKKKILFIIWSFTYGGGAEKILANIVNNLDKDKYEIDIIEYWKSNINSEYVNDNIGILPSILNEQKDNKIKKVYYKILLEYFPSFLRKKYIKKNYDIEISFNYLIPTFLLSKKTKTIAWLHGDIYDLNNKKRYKKLQRKSLKNVDKIVAISNNTLDSVKNVYPEYTSKTTLVNNGFNINKIIDKANEFNVENKEKQLLFLNRFDDNKNPLFAIEVAKELHKKGNKFKLIFIGKGKLEGKIREIIDKDNLQEYIEVVGYQKNPYPYIKNSHIVLGCSKSEGFPTIFVESIILGKPFVTTNVGGVLEISDNEKCGYIANDFDDYVEKVEKLLKDDKLYNKFSNHGIKHAEEFTLEKQIEKIENLMDDL